MAFVDGTPGIYWPVNWALQCIAIVAAAHLFMRNCELRALKLTIFGGFFLFMFFSLGVLYLAPINRSPFIYFQF